MTTHVIMRCAPSSLARVASNAAASSSDGRARARRASRVAHRLAPARALDGVDPYETTQLVSVAGTVAALGLTALALGAKGEPKPCAACSTTGGEPCAFCDASGRRSTPVKITQRDRNDEGVLGLTRRNPYECTACKGAGMILCRACRGSGYVD